MQFNSPEFIFLYLPAVLAGFFILARRSGQLAKAWLALASVFFYAWWNPNFVALLLASIVSNYGMGQWISGTASSRQKKWLLTGSVTANLMLLALFKYLNFFIASANDLGMHWSLLDIVLPMGISFFTFTQIAFLVDVYRGKAREHDFTSYLLFITWFPHLVSGPVLHHQQMMPQFSNPGTYKPNAESLAVGLTMFSIGLAKKTILADRFATFANPVFDFASQGGTPTLAAAWTGALCYSLQLYFDFSGYSDMAIGLSRIFNVKLPLNFNSPYKSRNIIEFWGRWHMTLSAFLRDYLYIPLGGNRHGPARRYVNLMITMLLGGMWHGAGWTFIIWGGLHGLYLVINHSWRTLFPPHPTHAPRQWVGACCTAITFMAVVVAWVPFRANGIDTMLTLLGSMFHLQGSGHLIAHAAQASPPLDTLQYQRASLWVVIGLVIVWRLPNSQQWLANHAPACDQVPVRPHGRHWQMTRGHALAMGLVFSIAVMFIKQNSPFLYFQF